MLLKLNPLMSKESIRPAATALLFQIESMTEAPLRVHPGAPAYTVRQQRAAGGGGGEEVRR